METQLPPSSTDPSVLSVATPSLREILPSWITNTTSAQTVAFVETPTTDTPLSLRDILPLWVTSFPSQPPVPAGAPSSSAPADELAAFEEPPRVDPDALLVASDALLVVSGELRVAAGELLFAATAPEQSPAPTLAAFPAFNEEQEQTEEQASASTPEALVPWENDASSEPPFTLLSPAPVAPSEEDIPAPQEALPSWATVTRAERSDTPRAPARFRSAPEPLVRDWASIVAANFQQASTPLSELLEKLTGEAGEDSDLDDVS